MARQQKLKVYRTPIGFHDAYVAAPSQKAALEVWGSDANLFARGVGELVTDEALTREPLDRPGEIVKRMRSAADEDGEAPAARRSRKTVHKPATEPREQHFKAAPGRNKAAPRPKPKPRPSRAALDASERALEDLTRRQDQEERDMRDRQRQLERERQALSQKHDQDREAAEKKIEKARKAHSAALDRWISDQS